MFNLKDEMVWLFIAMAIISGLVCHIQEGMSDDRVKIGIIDSGISPKQSRSNILCDGGMKSLIPRDFGYDSGDHGTNIFGLVSSNLDPKRYCIISYKIWNQGISDENSILKTIGAINKATKDGVKFLNISMSGQGSYYLEYKAFKEATEKMVVIVAAGNDDVAIKGDCQIYPACYRKLFNKNFYVIGAYDLIESNYGEYVDYFTYGKDMGKPLKSGTSQATAYFTNKFIQKNYINMVYKDRSLDVRFKSFRATTSK